MKNSFFQMHSIDALERLFPTTQEEIDERVEQAQQEFLSALTTIINSNMFLHNFSALAQTYDHAESTFLVCMEIMIVLEFVSPNLEIRERAHQAYLKLDAFLIDSVYYNEQLYTIFKHYHTSACETQLTPEERYYLHEILKEYRRRGFELPKEKRDQAQELQKEITALMLEFDHNIASDMRVVHVREEELEGLSNEFKKGLQKTPTGEYILGLDYPTYYTVLDHCIIASTREKIWQAATNKANPANKDVLQKLITRRNAFAHMIGYTSYAHFDIDNAMAQTPERVQEFINSLIPRSRLKAEQEFTMITRDLPPGVALVNGKLLPWDVRFVFEAYKKKYLALDEELLTQYFPMEHTIATLLDIYAQFFGIIFKEHTSTHLWHEDVRIIEAYTNENQHLLGYILLDPFPRPYKYSHACHIGVVPSLLSNIGRENPTVAVVVTNFPKATAEQPALWRRADVMTFFHEFGHALHFLFGATRFGKFAGTRVKTDFVELPSQMLEEWLWQPDVLRQVTAHYRTGQPLPDDLIKQLIQLKNFDTGFWLERQCALAQFSLQCFLTPQVHDIQVLMHAIFERIRQYVHIDTRDNLYLSFGHLSGYGAKYYSYLWSKVFALDVFNYIKQYGLRNQVIGKRYAQEILGQGGSVNPDILLHEFLGRDVQPDAFFQALDV